MISTADFSRVFYKIIGFDDLVKSLKGSRKLDGFVKRPQARRANSEE
jgi:hypothetical protein